MSLQKAEIQDCLFLQRLIGNVGKSISLVIAL